MAVNFNETLTYDISPTHYNPWSDSFVFEDLTQRTIIAIAACLVTLIGIPGNSLVIFAVILSKKLQNKTNIFVVNLACADMLTCAVLPFQAMSLFNGKWPFSMPLCRAVAIFVWSGLGSSVVNLALIAFIRYTIITKSRSYCDKLLTKAKLTLLVCGAWFVPFFFIFLPPAFGVGAVGYAQRYKICTADSTHPLSHVYAASGLIVEFPCLVVIVICYVKIYRFVKNVGRNLVQPRNRLTISENPESSQQRRASSTEHAIFRRQVKETAMAAVFNDSLFDERSSASSTPGSDDFVFESSNQRLTAAIVTCLVTVIGIPGNSIVILAVMLSKKLQNKTNIFVVNLACANILTCAVLPFQAVALVNETWPLSSTLCKTVAILMWLGLGSGVMNLTLIAYTRYCIITKSRRLIDRIFTNINIVLLVCGAWFIPPLIILIPPAFGVGAVAYSHRYKLCTADSSNPMSDIYAYIYLIVEFPCLVVIIVCYFNIYRFLKKADFNLTQSTHLFTVKHGLRNAWKRPQTSTEVAVFRRQVKVTKNLFIIVCTYIICVMPLGLACAIPAPVYPIIPWAYLLLFLNLCLNPIIYGLEHPQFKQVFGPIMTCSWRNIPEPSPLITSFSTIVTKI